jgi:hypothetical protein
MATNAEGLNKLGQLLVQYWQLLIPLFFGLSLSFQTGYFYVPLGVSFYHVSVEDLSKTGLILAIGSSVTYGIVPFLNALPVLERKLSKVLLFALVVAIFLGFDLFNLSSNLHADTAVARAAIAFFICKILLVLLFGIALLVWKYPERLLNLDALAFAYLLMVSFTFSYGVKSFYDDIQETKYIVAKADGEHSTTAKFVTERTYFYLAQSIDDCSFLVIQKADVGTAKFESMSTAEASNPKIAKCPLSR